ncbi:hypothetical protein DM01DRAFT_198878 [Hesseltinella vesiculosa]|uniref:Mid2 domain-containing protein n=1 Tax=Hesseltinella vesiculosa TaxID=101127 RepID=A0A1X2GBJ1_9FUNG|nr:hypothetical protein DM01DRAFT_198878 [Hesseltinella vesiculosa]
MKLHLWVLFVSVALYQVTVVHGAQVERRDVLSAIFGGGGSADSGSANTGDAGNGGSGGATNTGDPGNGGATNTGGAGNPPTNAPTTAAPPATTSNVPPPATTSVVPTTTAAPPPPPPPSSAAPSTTAVPTTTVAPTSSGRRPTSAPVSSNTISSDTSSMTSTTSSSPSASPSNQSSGTSAGTIAGAVVGGVVGLALIGGLIAWLNRRGGCASRRKPRQNPDFEDFGLQESDFPHHRSPGMVAAAVGSTPSLSGASHPSPTVPRMTDLNNGAAGGYYATMPSDYDSGRHFTTGYEDYGNQPQQYHQGYYYPEPNQPGAYQERYYYENQQPSSAVLPPAGQGYEAAQPAHSPTDHLKPDERN